LNQFQEGDTKMKKTAYTMIALLVLVGSMAVAAQAQTIRHAEVRANIPFQFHVRDTTLPAGEYVVRQLTADSDAVTLQISRKDGGASAIVNMIGAAGDAGPMTKLTFRRYGNQYYFAEVWIDGARDGLRAPKSKVERATQKELAALKVSMETVALSVR
jgi:hypothetical protein